MGQLQPVKYLGGVLVVEPALGRPAPVQTEAEQVLAVFEVVSDPGASRGLQQCAAAIRVSGAEKGHPGVVDKPGRRERQTLAALNSGFYPIVGIPAGEMDIVKVDAILGSGPSDFYVIKIFVVAKKGIEPATQEATTKPAVRKC